MQSNSPSITNIDEAKLIPLIKSANQRLVIVAPGLTEPIANEIAAAWQHLGPRAVTVILDADPEVCRLGYGTLEGLKLLETAAQTAGALLCHQQGVRIGLVIADDTTVIYTPTPLLIEAGSDRADQPNAVLISGVPMEITNDLGLDGKSERKLGRDPIRPERVQAVAEDLERNPPAKFDIARKVRVFNSRFQFVELEMTGCFISKKKVTIPSELLGFARDEQTRQRLHASFDLVGKTDLTVEVSAGKVISEESLRRKKAEIAKSFLISLPPYGSVILRSNKGRGGDDGTPLRRTPWGEIAWQLGRCVSDAEAKARFETVAEHDKALTASSREVIRKLLPKNRGCLILLDELMNYVSRSRKSGMATQLYNFLQNLSETARGEDRVVLAVSIPASELEMTAEDVSDYERFKKLLDRLGKPLVMSAEAETSEIIRRRLFEWDERAVNQEGKVQLSKDAIETCNEYADWVAEHRQETRSKNSSGRKPRSYFLKSPGSR